MVVDYLGNSQEENDCYRITHGHAKGEWGHKDDVEHATHRDGDDVVYVDDDIGDLVWDHNGELIEADDAETTHLDGDVAHRDDCVPVETYYDGVVGYELDGHHQLVEIYDDASRYALDDDCVWVESRSIYVFTEDDDYQYHEGHEEYYHEDDYPRADGEDDRINEYHCSPDVAVYQNHPMMWFGGKYLPNPEYHKVFDSYTIGFEVEKNSVDGCYDEGDPVDEQPLFAGWETDSSCGVEGITNAYSLNMGGRLKSDIDRSPLVNSPTDGSCGGHVNVRGEGLTIEAIRPYVGLIYALYRGRLTNGFCAGNIRLDVGAGSTYPAIKNKGGGMIEFRVVSRVTNGVTLWRRFLLFKEIMWCVHHKLSFNGLMRRTRKILRTMYPDPCKRAMIRDLAYKFQRYVELRELHLDIAEWVADGGATLVAGERNTPVTTQETTQETTLCA